MRRAIPVLAALLVLVITLTLTPTRAFAAGWLGAFVFLSMIPIGSLALLLIHGITGGRWGEDFSPVLEPAARTMPLLLLAFLPIILLRPDLYPWPAHEVPADVARDYLNPLFFAFRTVVALIIWSVMVWYRLWTNQLWAGLALVVHGLLITFVPPDWVLTLRPISTSAGFGLGFGIEQMFAALGFVALLAPQGDDPRAGRDLAGIIVTTLLGTVYFDFMAFLIIWYGNVPEKVDWYVARTYGAWPAVAFASFVLAAAIPFLAVLSPSVRAKPAPMRVLGGLVLAGIALHVAWLTMPIFGYGPAIPAILSGLVLALLAVAALPVIDAARLRYGR